MFQKVLLIFIALFLSHRVCNSSEISGASQQLKITYIANEGFLIEIHDKSILIDALFGNERLGFADAPSPKQLELMKNAKGNFKKVDLILTTHSHRDHFYAPYVVDHLSNNKNAQCISSEQSVLNIKKAGNYHAKIQNQIIEITPDSLTYKDTTVQGIDIKIFRLAHGPYYIDDPETGRKVNKHRHVQNLGFLIHVNGIKIFHSGDSSPKCKTDYENFRLDQENIDIAILGRGFLWDSDSKTLEFLKNYMNPKHIILMHIHHDQNERFMQIAKEIEDEFQSVKVFEKAMESKIYQFN